MSDRDDDDDDDDEEEEKEVFPPFNEKSTRRPRNPGNTQGINVEYEGYMGNITNRFSFSDNCYIVYHTLQPNVICIDTFQCDSNNTPSIPKGSGRKLMNAFLHYYLTKNSIPLSQNVEILLIAVSPYNQRKLNKYYRDIGFQQLDSYPRFANFKGNINDVLFYTENYPRYGTAGKTRRRKKRKNAKRTNRRL